MDLCEELFDDHELVVDNDVICWINDMNAYVKQKSLGTLELPLEDGEVFLKYLK